MMYYIIKVVITAIIVVMVSEASKRNTFIGALLASVPLISVLSFVWLYIDTKDTQRIAELSTQILWLVVPSLLLFVLFPILLKTGLGFYVSLGVAAFVMILGYLLAAYLRHVLL